MYVPRHWHWVFPTGLILAGFYIHENLNGSWDVIVFVNVPLALIGVEWGTYLWQAGVLHQKYITHLRETAEQSPEKNYTVVPLKDEYKPVPNLGPVQIEQVVSLPRFDKERNFAVTLLRMHEYDPAQVNLTEERWVKTKKFGRAEYTAMLTNWYEHGVIGRAGSRKNAPYRVERWEAVRLIAEGNPLPRRP